MGKLTWTHESEKWLRDIFDYIQDENPDAARSVVTGIFEKAQVLEKFPEAGYRYEASDRNVRILLYGHYRIAYLVRENQDVDILGVFHGALDIRRYAL
ncbi:MAG: type II toxin-antitoxin system RelE/ParE family toxin [Cyanobacteria bacterium J06648_11]